jgi:hypothetical protein
MIVYFSFLVHFPFDGCNPSTSPPLTPEKPPRSMSQTKSSRHKSKSSSRKGKSDKTNEHYGEAKWYLETLSSINTNNNNDNTTISSTISTPSMDRSSTRKLGRLF